MTSGDVCDCTITLALLIEPWPLGSVISSYRDIPFSAEQYCYLSDARGSGDPAFFPSHVPVQ